MTCPMCQALWPDYLAVMVDADLIYTFTPTSDGYVKAAETNTYDEYTLMCTNCQWQSDAPNALRTKEEVWDFARDVDLLPDWEM